MGKAPGAYTDADAHDVVVERLEEAADQSVLCASVDLVVRVSFYVREWSVKGVMSVETSPRVPVLPADCSRLRRFHRPQGSLRLPSLRLIGTCTRTWTGLRSCDCDCYSRVSGDDNEHTGMPLSGVES